MDGCVKTLHRKVHGGILGRRGQDDAIMEEHQIRPIDMVKFVNLYPFAQTVAREGCSLEDAVGTSISAARPWCAPPLRTIKMSQSW